MTFGKFWGRKVVPESELFLDLVKHPWAVIGPGSLREDGVLSAYQTLRCAVHTVIHTKLEEGARNMRVVNLRTGERFDYGGCLAVWSLRGGGGGENR